MSEEFTALLTAKERGIVTNVIAIVRTRGPRAVHILTQTIAGLMEFPVHHKMLVIMGRKQYDLEDVDATAPPAEPGEHCMVVTSKNNVFYLRDHREDWGE